MLWETMLPFFFSSPLRPIYQLLPLSSCPKNGTISHDQETLRSSLTERNVISHEQSGTIIAIADIFSSDAIQVFGFMENGILILIFSLPSSLLFKEREACLTTLVRQLFFHALIPK